VPSVSFQNWSTVRAAALDAVERAHTAIRRTGPGRREAVRQLNHAYAVLLAAEFQGFCRELHTEAVEAFVANLPPAQRTIIKSELTWNRQLDRGNATPATLGSDFGRLGLDWRDMIDSAVTTGPILRQRLEELNLWRNAVAHHDFNAARLGGTMPMRLTRIRRWRISCHRLAIVTDRVLADHLLRVTGSRPW
jgi:hypothetical protein